MPAYLFQPVETADVPTVRDAKDDDFFWRQGPARGLGSIRFQDWEAAYRRFAGVPNVARFHQQAQALRTLLTKAAPDAEQQADLDFLLTLGQLFTLVVYGQLVLEQAALTDVDSDLLDQVFDVLVRDYSAWAVALHGKASSTGAQQEWALGQVRKPVVDRERFERVWDRVAALSGAYEMRP
jgi:acyl-CoA dehydrogenase